MSSEPFIHQVALYEYQKMFPEKRLICILKNSNESKQYEFIVNLNTSPVCFYVGPKCDRRNAFGQHKCYAILCRLFVRKI